MAQDNTANEPKKETVRIANDVVATIAGVVASETPGVIAMSGGLSEGWAKRLTGKNVQKGVAVDVGEVETSIDLRIIVKYGLPIHEVCRQLQVNVHDAIQNMTGLHVVAVNVIVDGVSLKEEDAPTAAQTKLLEAN
ncbi:Asp23/Gls24 family envelope stress response protein [Brevibacillus daliensis]|uniref:Asp23/Gls24 family envelope stress response protein n=1 Tax=Brevibacillus daliensis TaxID=2892995 RepID=UPI001E2F728A|nr:Asp23/Gls24 family envelope stress response protein [Brevibacillus daliensis]